MQQSAMNPPQEDDGNPSQFNAPDQPCDPPERFQDEVLEVYSYNLDEDQSDTGESDEIEPIQPLVVTTYRADSLHALYSTHGPIPYYPDTHPEGHVYIHSMKEETRSVKEIFDDVQFCHRRDWGPKITTSALLNNAQCKRETHICTGIKACEYLHPKIRDMDVQQVNQGIWEELKQYGVEDWDDENRKREALSWFLGIRNSFLKETSCERFIKGSCRYIFVRRDAVTASGISQYCMMCINQAGSTGRDHFFRPLDPKYTNQVDFLQRRAATNVTPKEYEPCSYITSTLARSNACGIDHFQGQGRLQRSNTCQVKFHLITPTNLLETPYILWVSTGVHNHPPPPIHKVPGSVRQNIVDLFIRMKNPDLTINKAIVNQEVFSWLREHNVSTFGQLHPALNNRDRLGLYILQQKLFTFPHGQSIGGVRFEYWSNHKDNPDRYIQDFWFDGVNLVVFCFFKEQVAILAQQSSFEIDMGFKRVRDSEITEIVIGKFLESIRKVIILARFFVNSDTTETYRYIFMKFHKLLQERFQITLKWRHLDSTGNLKAVVVDQDPKQMAGFGGYLQTLDKDKRDWQFHAQSSMVFCKIHYQRGVEKLIGKPIGNQLKHQMLMDIPNCKSREDYMHLCDLIIQDDFWSKKVRDWARYLKQPTIAAGLNKSCSRMNPNDFDSIRNNTNAVEVAHWRGNSVGRRCSLLQAIRNSQMLDRADIEQYYANTKLSIDLTYRKKAMSDRYQTTMRRSYSQRTKEIENSNKSISQNTIMSIPENADLTIPSEMQDTTSSGVHRKKRNSTVKTSTQKAPKPAQDQSKVGSLPKRLRSLTLESDYEFIQYERSETLRLRQEVHDMRKSIADMTQKEPEVKKTTPVQEVEEEEQERDSTQEQSIISWGTVWNGFTGFTGIFY